MTYLKINLFILLFGIIFCGTILEGYSQSLVKSQDMTDTQESLVRTLVSEIAMDLEMVKESEDDITIDSGETVQFLEYSGEYNSEYLFKSTVRRIVSGYSDVKFHKGFERMSQGIGVTMLVFYNDSEFGMIFMSFTGADSDKQYVTATY